MDVWQSILDKSQQLLVCAEEKEWSKVDRLGDELQTDLECFFSTVEGLSTEERRRVLIGGEEVVCIIQSVLEQARIAQEKIKQEAGKYMRGKKGVSAYKNI